MGHKLEKRGGWNRAHGFSHTPEYDAYRNAKARCTSPREPKWRDYGGRGIKFLFKDFEEFAHVLGPRPTPDHSLDRYPDNNGHYEPTNVRWATRSEQQKNQRTRKCLQNYTDEELVDELRRRRILR